MIPTPLLLALIAGGAYYFGRRAARRAPAPTPPALPEPRAWGALGYDVHVFPPGSAIDTFDPPAYDGVTVAPDCSAVAVGEGFFDSAAAARELLPPVTTVEAVLAQVLPSDAHRCFEAGALALELLRDELAERLFPGAVVAPLRRPGEMVPRRRLPSPYGAGDWQPWSPNRRNGPTVLDAVWGLGGRRR